MLTSRSGTTIVFRGSPFTCARTRSDASASVTSSPSGVPAGDPQAVAELAVDLHDDLDGLGGDERRVGLGPRLLAQPRVAEPLPQLLGDVRRVRLDEREHGLGREADLARPRRVVLDAVDLVHELEQRGDRRVELEAAQDVVGDAVDRPVGRADQRAVRGHLDRARGLRPRA